MCDVALSEGGSPMELARIHASIAVNGDDPLRDPQYTVNEPVLDMRHTFTRSTSISVAVDPVALITTECITVTSAMRKHARWAHSSVSAILGGGATQGYEASQPSSPRDGMTTRKGQRGREQSGVMSEGEWESGLAHRWGLRGKKGKSMQDNPLMSAFARLRSDLTGCKGIYYSLTCVIRSSSTSAPITSLALVAITKFFAYNLISQESPRLSLAMQLLSSAITHCRFEASDSAADEIVLLRILKLMEGMISGPGGELLGDESVCEMMETGLSMCCQMRLSELLRRSAEMSMVTMCQAIFERLKHLEVEAGGELGALEESTKEDMNTVKMDPSVNGDQVTSPSKAPTSTRSSSSIEKSLDGASETTALAHNGSETNLAQVSAPTEASEVKPYSLPSIRELFRVLVELLDPHNRQHTDAMRVIALRILDVALEVAGPSIPKHPSLANLAMDDLCRYLFQLVRSDNMAILQGSLRVTGTLLATCRGVLKLQQELFLSYVVACLHPRVEIPREAGIDSALYKGVPQAPPSQVSSGRSTPVPVKDRKKLGMEGGSRKPDAREAMVESVGALARIPSFMVELYINYDCEVDRGDLCEDMVGLLSRNAFPDSATWSTTNVPPLCLDALLGYVGFIADRLDNIPVYDGYPDRDYLKKQRERKKLIIRGAAKFNEKQKAGIAYLASQNIIDNPDNPVSVAKFLKGTTRISKKVLGEFLSKKSNEDILGAFLDLFDFTGKRVDEALRDLLESFRLPGESPLIERIVTSFSEKYCSNSTPEGIADKDAVYVLTYAIIMLNTDQHNPNLKSQNRMKYTDFSRNLRGVNGGQDFAPEYLQEIYDSIRTREIILPDEHDNKDAFDYAWKELLLKTESAKNLVLCDTNIFDADMFEATWKPVVATLSYVFMSASDDAVFSRVITGFDQCARIAARYGLADAFDHIIFCLSTIGTLASEAPSNTSLNTEIQVNDNSVMVSEMAVKFGRDFKAQLATVVLFRVVTGNEFIIREGWKYIVRIWLNLFVNSLIPPFFSPAQSTLDIPPIPLQTPSQVIDRAQKANESGLFSTLSSYLSSYAADDPPEPSDEELESTLCTVDCINSCFLGDIFANIMDKDTVESFGKEAAEALQSVIRDAANVHHITVSRAVFYLLGLLQASHEHSFLRAPVVLHTISSLDQRTQERSALSTISGLSHCIKNPGPLRNEMTNSPDFWSILRSILAVPEAAAAVFEIVQNVTVGIPSAITADNYEPAVSLLNDFASAASVGALYEQKGDKTARRKSGKNTKPQDNGVVIRGSKSIDIIYQLTGRVSILIKQSHLERNEAWTTYWSPIFRALTSQCVNPCREIRHQAFSSLQRSLLSPELTSTDHKEWTAIFGEVLFPLIIRLLKPEVYQSDPIGMSETRVQAATLLCKIFLHYLVLLSEWDGMLDLWLRILDIMDRLMNSGQGDSLVSARKITVGEHD
ncbi:hypothetical protein GP486_004230 [Trichoglossum hirsutum]|uniref:SEC7 domain-containing protein n=1 Tax=Trichoglossum hirsutum TaxID=265104 RepID=A0A9P8RPH1_9PEZI|nr:hypothetical protein GP486_004230 [Trichoglossum hirsutum]